MITSDCISIQIILLMVAEIIIRSALIRNKSVGLHYMENCSDTTKNVDTIIQDIPGISFK